MKSASIYEYQAARRQAYIEYAENALHALRELQQRETPASRLAYRIQLSGLVAAVAMLIFDGEPLPALFVAGVTFAVSDPQG